MESKIRSMVLFTIAFLSLAMHFKHFSKDLMSIHVWRQTQTQSTIINFYEEDMNILNPRRNDRGKTEGIYRMEFPLMQWLTACLYKVFGNHLIITRIFMFLIGLLTVFGMYKLMHALFQNTTLSLIGAWTFNFSPSFYYYTINPLPDNLALCFSVWGLAAFFQWHSNRKNISLIFSSAMLALGALCKLPFIIFLVVPLVYFFREISGHGLILKHFRHAILAFGFSILPIIWYLSVIPHWGGNVVVKGMLNNQVPFEKLLEYYRYNLFSTLPELLLGYSSLLFFLASFYFILKKKSFRDNRFLPLLSLGIMALVYYLFEANAIEKTHDYYLFPFYPLLFILVSYGAFQLTQSNHRFIRFIAILLLIAAPFTCYLRMQDRWNPDSPGFNKDLLTYKVELQKAVPKNALVVAGNDISHHIFFYYIDKKGWGFDKDRLSGEELKSMIQEGAQYLYTDSEALLSNNEIAQYFDELIMEKGTIKIFRLKIGGDN